VCFNIKYNLILGMNHMKAIICTKYGPPDVLQLKEIEKPTPKDNEVLIRVYASTASVGDAELRNLKFSFLMRIIARLGFGIRGPRKKVLGQDLAGEIEAIGKDVKLFKKGDHVFGSTGFGLGGNAEYKCLSEKAVITIIPATMTYEEATTIPFGGLDALHFLRKANIQNGQKVLINGAGGSIGTAAIQLAKHYGSEVTGVDSVEKLEMLQSIGADKVINYAQEDFTKNGETYDVIFDVIGKSSFSGSKKSLSKRGYYLLANPGMSDMFRALWSKMTSRKNVIIGASDPKISDLIFLQGLIEAGKIKAVIDRRYPLEQAKEAHIYVDTGKKKGNVVLTLK
jgi:NADPH:quinone reductase-like Zn-dependent oxidoreductase